jgi:hypothetical protein
MKVEVEKKKDQFFRNTQDYNGLIEEIQQIGVDCKDIYEFNNKLASKWNELVDKYYKKHEANIFSFFSQPKTKNGEEYIFVYLKHDIDEEKIKQLEQEQYEKQQENEKQINKLLEDDQLYVNDMRVTDDMIRLYKLALMESKSTLIKNPHYILDNIEKMKKSFYEYLIDVISNPDYCGIERRIMLESQYATYMSHITGIPIIFPDGLEYA